MARENGWNDPVHPGEILAQELDFIALNAATLAGVIGVPKNRLYEILKGERSVTADTAIRLGAFFGMSPKFWLNLQKSYELAVAIQKIGKEAKSIKPYQRSLHETPPC